MGGRKGTAKREKGGLIWRSVKRMSHLALDMGIGLIAFSLRCWYQCQRLFVRLYPLQLCIACDNVGFCSLVEGS